MLKQLKIKTSLPNVFMKHLAVLLCLLLYSISSINAQWIKITPPTGPFCVNQNYNISFTDSAINASSTIQVYISNTLGVFVSGGNLIGTSVNKINPVVVTLPATAGSGYKLRIVSSSPLAYDTTISTITIFAKPIAGFTFTPNNASCAGTTVNFTNTSSGANPLFFLWTFTGGTGAPGSNTNQNPTVSFSPPKGGSTVVFNINLLVTDNNGCTNNLSNNIDVKQVPDPILSDSNIFAVPPFSNCQGNPSLSNPNFRLTVNNNSITQSLISNYTLNWGIGGPVFLPSTFVKSSYIYTSLGAFDLTLTAININGCSASKSYKVANQSNPAVGLNTVGNTQGCAPQTFPFILGQYQNNSPGTYYIFDFDDGTPNVRWDIVVTDTIWHTFNQTSCTKPGGAFTVKVTAYNFCDSTAATVNNIRIWTKPKAAFNILPDTVICVNTSATFQNTSTPGYYSSACSNTTLYAWTFSGGNPNSSTAFSPPPILYITPGVYNIKLAATNPCGTDTIVKPICVQPIPIPNFTYNYFPANRCAPLTVNLNNTSNTLTSCGGTTYTWTTIPTNGVSFTSGTNPNSINPVLQFTQSGLFTIRLTVTNKCSTVVKNDTITIKGPPIVSLSPAISYCGQQDVLFDTLAGNHRLTYNKNFGSISSINWSVTPAGATFINGTNSTFWKPQIRFTDSTASKTYNVTVALTNECGTSFASQLITILPSVGPPIVRDTMRCGSGTFTLPAILGANGTTLRWYNDSTTSTILFTGNPFTTPSLSTTRSYFVSSFNTSTSCESYRVRITVTINPIPNLPTTNNVSRCGPGSVTLSATVGLNGNALRWYNASTGGTLLYVGNPFVTPILSSTTDYWVTSFNSTTLCESSRVNVKAFINQIPTVKAGNDTSFCLQIINIQLVNFSPAGGSWSGTGITPGGVFNPANAGLGTHKLIYTYTDGNGCTNKDSINASVINLSTVDAGVDRTACLNSPNITLIGSPLGGTWSGPNVTPPGIFSPTTAGVFKLYYTIGSGSCASKDSLNITVNLLPAPNFTLVTGVCPFQIINLSATNGNSTIITNYKWSVWNSRNFNSSILNDSNIINPTASFPENKTADTARYYFKLVLTNSFGCKDSITKNLTFNKRPNASFNVTGAGCGPLNPTISNNSSNNPSTWLWSVNPSTGVILTNSTGIIPTITLPNNPNYDSLNYSIKLSATLNGIGANCFDTTTRIVTIYPKPLVNFTSSDTVGCTPLQVNFFNTSDARNYDSRNTMSFIWRVNNYIESTDSQFTKIFTNNVPRDSSISIRLLGTTKNGCKDSIQKNITLRPNPIAAFSSTTQTSCTPFYINSSIISLIQYPQANNSYNWTIFSGNGITIRKQSTGTSVPPDTLLQPNDSLIYRLITTNIYNCKPDTKQVKFYSIPSPVANFSMSDSAGCTPLTISFTNLSSVGASVKWFFSSGDSSLLQNPIATFINNSNTNDLFLNAKLIVTAGTGCKDTIVKAFRIYPKPKSIFNIAQPNICPLSNISTINSSISKLGATLFRWKVINNDSIKLSDTTLTSPIITLPDNQTSFDSSFSIRLRTISVDGCVHDSIKPFVLLRRPKVIFSNPLNGCGPFSFAPLNNTSNIPAAQLNWLWKVIPNIGVTIATATIQNPIISLPLNTSSDSIVYKIKLIATRTASGCVDSAEKELTIFPKPTIAFTSNQDTACTPLNAIFTNTSDPNNYEPLSSMTFSWKLNNTFVSSSIGYSNTFINNTQKDSIVTIRLIGTTIHGCIDSSNKSIIIRPDAKAQFTAIKTVSCAPFVINSSNITAINYPNANDLYQWFANDVLIGSGLNFPIYTILNQDDSVYIKLRTRSKYGCKNDSVTLVFKTIQNPKPNFVATDSIGCSPLSLVMNNTSLPPTGLTYLWKVGAFTSTLKNPPFTIFNYSSFDTTVQAKLVVTAGVSGCYDSIQKSIIIKPLPRPDFKFIDTLICFPKKLEVLNLSSFPPSLQLNGYKWKVTGIPTAVILNDTASISTEISIPDNQSGFSVAYGIKLIAKSDYGCIDSINKPINIPTRPVANFNLPKDSICSGANLTTINSSQYSNSTLWFAIANRFSILNPTGTNTGLIFPPHTGFSDSIYYLKLLVKNNIGCADSLTKPIIVFPKPIAKFVSDTNMGCSPLAIKFTNQTIGRTPLKYSWNFGNGNNDTITNPTAIFFGSSIKDSIFRVSLLATSINGCPDTVSSLITVKPNAVARLKITDSIFCFSGNNPVDVSLFNQSYGEVDSFIYELDGIVKYITTSDTLIKSSYSLEGTYNVKLTAINKCKTSYDSVSFKVLKAPYPAYILSDTVGCGPLKVFPSNLTSNYEGSYLWDFGNGLTSNLKNPDTVTYYQGKIADSLYLFKLTVTNYCGAKSVQDTIRVLPIPIVNFLLSTDSGCSPLPVNFVNLTTGLPSNHKWYFGNGDSSIKFNPTMIIYRTDDSLTIYTVRLIESNVCGIDSMQKSIKVYPNTVHAFFNTSGTTGCAPLKVNFFNYSVGGNNVSWHFGDGNTSNNPNPVYTYNNPGVYYAYQFVNNGCSYDTTYVIINVLQPPRFTISKSKQIICKGSPVQFNSYLLDSGDITWHFGDGDSSNAFNPSHKYSISGKMVIKVILRAFTNNCPKEIYDTITVVDLPKIVLTVDTNSACANRYFKFDASSTNALFFDWDFGDSNFAVGPIVQHKYQKDGNYVVKLVAQNLNGCIDSTNMFVYAYPVPVASFDYSPKDTCQGPVTVKFNNTSKGATGYDWSFGNSQFSTLVNPTTTYTSVGTYPIRLIASNQFLCRDTAKVNYNVYNIPIALFDFSNASGCPPLPVTFTNKSIFGSKFIWDFGDGDTSSEMHPIHKYSKSGFYTVKLTAVEGGMCIDTISKSKIIEVFPKPYSNFEPVLDLNDKPYGLVRMFNNTDSSSFSSWDFGDGKYSNDFNPVHRYNRPDSFAIRLVSYSSKGCADTLYKWVYIPWYEKGLFVPNAFTPESPSPEVNTFLPVGLELKTYHIRIYNKWGEFMWESNKINEKGEPAEGWNGLSTKGQPCMQGSYVWIIEATFQDDTGWDGQVSSNGFKQRSGNLTLIR